MKFFGIVYGALGRSDYFVDAPFATVKAARDAYDRSKRIHYDDGVLGGAAIAEVVFFGAWCPERTIETIAGDELREGEL